MLPGVPDLKVVPADGAPDDRLPAAVLFDMDGTLVDTEPFWMSAEVDLAAAYGAAWTHQDALAMVGNPLPSCAAALRERGVPLADDEIIDVLCDRVAAGVAAGIPWQAGAEELLHAVRDAGLPMALVTSSYRRLAEPFAAAVGLFDVVVAGDDVRRPKPDPEPYLTAAARLGVDVAACVAVEDSRSGIASALASGARVLAVEVMQPVTAQPGLSRVASLADVSVAHLARVHGGEVLDLRRAG